MWGKRLRWPALRDLSKRGRVAVLCVLLSTLVFGAGAFGRAVVQAAPGGVQLAIAANASCAALARADQTATNGSNWGRTILSGHNAYHGWFGVDVCSNGSNYVAPNSANVSCDAIPKNWNKAGCAPGGATSDGFGLTFQCVELVARFSAWAYGDAPGRWLGNAPDLWLPGNHPSDFVMYPNGSSHAPVPGDILVWGSLDAHGNPGPAGPDGQDGGHVAVVAAVHDGLIVTAEENVKWGSDDHPSDTLGLTKVGSRWIVSGTSAHDTHLPTYRWRSTMGTARGMYGWLHSTRNDGTFPASKHPATSVPKTPGKAPQQTSGGLPSLAAATLVTDSGGLADLVWTTTSLFGTAPTDGTAYATARSLGAPTPARLITGQTPATVLLPDGTRYSYAVGADGHLYVARTSPRTIGVYWFDHGAPPNVMLEPFLSATRFAGGMAVAALGSDGNLWWRAGPDGSLGDWMPLGRPGNAGLTGSFALAGAPGQGTPLVVSLGQDGTLYERVWQNALLDGDGNVTVPAGWSDWIAIAAQQNGPRLAGKLVVVSEMPGTHSLIGAWSDTPLD
ncbi:MAG TPA: CHAP domain-containing protein, partial [Ktedonobacterales bacterium]|nr:CHAP domain-containing protein [Ktedonobacterales bacterium]